MNYIIAANNETDFETGKPLYWNNEDGWTLRDQATRFTEGQRAREALMLPAGGYWVIDKWPTEREKR